MSVRLLQLTYIGIGIGVFAVFFSWKTFFVGELNNMERKFPSNLEDFGYRFNEREQLRHIETGKQFEFAVSADANYNQERYDALGKVIDHYVYDLLLKESLEKVEIPVDAKGDAASTFIFQSPDALCNPQKLLLLIHGSGVVRAGQWARRLIINDSLQRGSQIGYIRRAIALGYGVLVLNTNDNERDGVKIRGSESAEEHALYVWDMIVSKAMARHVAIVAHSYGGVVTMNLLASRPDAINRIMAIAFTDSVHVAPPASILNDVREVAKNWQRSDRPLDTILTQNSNEIATVSAGTTDHTLTSWAAFASVFDFLEEMYMKTLALEGSV